MFKRFRKSKRIIEDSPEKENNKKMKINEDITSSGSQSAPASRPSSTVISKDALFAVIPSQPYSIQTSLPLPPVPVVHHPVSSVTHPLLVDFDNEGKSFFF